MNLQTKQDFQDLMHLILNPLKPRYSAGGARLPLGDTGVTYDSGAIEMEGFSRPLWALVPYWAGGAEDADFSALYHKGLANGTNPAHAEYWGECADYDQRFVEMAAIACGLLFAPEHTWNPLSATEKENLATWLFSINQHVIPECNWQFFMILVNVALKKRGMPYDAQNMEAGLAKIESYYQGDGWYQDGEHPQKDYYVPFAFHYYGLVYAKVMEQDDPRRSALFKERASVFAHQFIHWFSEDGAALPFGRSLTYRFAEASFWSACLFAGIEPFSIGVMKGLLVRHMQYWLRQSMFDRDGILTIGYAYPNLLMAERYNAPGSPYWSMKTFLMLALPDAHPFWSATALPLPTLAPIAVLPYADMLIQHRKNDVVAYVPGNSELYGHGNVPQKYAKFAYSTAFGFSVSRSNFVLHEACPDSMLAFEIDDTIFVRKISKTFTITADKVVSQWSPFPGIDVLTTITPTQQGHIRQHVVHSTFACKAYDCGFSVEKFRAGDCMQTITTTNATVQNKHHACTVVGQKNAAAGVLSADPNTNILFQNTWIPYVAYAIAVGETKLETEIITEVFE